MTGTEPCLACGAATVVALTGVRDNRFGTPGDYTILECRRCGLAQTSPRPTPAALKRLYEEHYNYGGESGTSYERRRERFLLSPLYRVMLAVDGDISFHAERGEGRLLDIGCNEGRGLALYRRNGFDADGLELNEVAAAAARARGFVVHTVLLQGFEPAQPYDRAVLSNVLEHALDPRAMLADVRRILAPGGEVWISLPNRDSWLARRFGRSWINWHVPFHITHFSARALTRLLAEGGFTVLSVRQATPALWVAQSAIAWLDRDRVGEPRRQRNLPLLAGVMLFARGLLFPLLWAINRVGRGDCLVVKARRS